MIYTAKFYVKLSGRMYTPGELIHTNHDDDPVKIERLLKLGAIIPDDSALECEDATPDADDTSVSDDSALECADAEPDNDDTPAPKVDAMDGITRPAAARGRKKK